MPDLDEYVSKFVSNGLSRVRNPQLDQISKMIVADSEVKNDTEPNAMVVGSFPTLGFGRVSAHQILKVLLCHPSVERGIEFKFNRMIEQLDKNNIANNIIPKTNSKDATNAKEYITDIFYNSSVQPLTWVKQYGRDAMRFGDNYAVLKTNRAMNKVLRWELQNPIFFSPMFDVAMVNTTKTGISPNYGYNTAHLVRFRINPVSKKPKEYTQLKQASPNSMISYGNSPGISNNCGARYLEFDGKTNSYQVRFIPTGKTFKAARVMQLNFDRIGDDPLGIPIAQTLVQTVSQIVRVEDSGAETMVAFGNNRWMAHTPFRSKEKMQEFAKSIENIRKRSVVILPEGVKLETVKPGSTEFDKVHDILLTLIAMRMGISIIQLKGTGADINKSTFGFMMKDIRSDFFADELELEKSINEGIIKSCVIRYNLNTPDKLRKFPYPVFSFNVMDEDVLDKAERLLKTSLSLRNVTFSVDALMERGFNTEAKRILDSYMNEILPDRSTQEDFVQDPVGANK